MKKLLLFLVTISFVSLLVGCTNLNEFAYVSSDIASRRFERNGYEVELVDNQGIASWNIQARDLGYQINLRAVVVGDHPNEGELSYFFETASYEDAQRLLEFIERHILGTPGFSNEYTYQFVSYNFVLITSNEPLFNVF